MKNATAVLGESLVGHGEAPTISRRGRLLQPGLLGVLFIAWYLLRLPAQWEHDPYRLFLGCQVILYWLQGRLHVMPDVGPFPLLQYLTGVASLWAGSRGVPINVFWVWSTCNTVGLAGVGFIFYRAACRLRQPATAWTMVAVILSGPLVAYAPMTLIEGFAAFLVLWFTDVVTGEIASPVWCAVLFWCCGISKETAVPLLAIIWTGAIWLRRLRLSRRQLLVHGVAMMLAITAALFSNMGFNLFRYGTLLNKEYVSPDFVVRSWAHRLSYMISLWLAPNGGAAPSWPTLMCLVLGVCILGFRRRDGAGSAIIAVILLGALTLGLSAWYGPFGWWCWGPRLMLPWLPASALILLKGYPQAFERLVYRLIRSRRAFLVTAAAMCVFAWPHLMVASDPEVINSFFEKSWDTPSGQTMTQPAEVYARNMYLAWRKFPPLMVLPVIDDVTFGRLLLGAGYSAALVLLLNQARRSLDLDQTAV